MELNKDAFTQAGELQAAGADAQTLREPADVAHSVLGSLCYQMTAPSQGSGQAGFLLWPKVLLENRLPFDINFCLKGDADMSGRGTPCCACST